VRKRLPPDVLEFFREQGRTDGKIGGKKLAEKMTPEQRTASARRAGFARAQKAAAAAKKSAGPSNG